MFLESQFKSTLGHVMLKGHEPVWLIKWIEKRPAPVGPTLNFFSVDGVPVTFSNQVPMPFEFSAATRTL